MTEANDIVSSGESETAVYLPKRWEIAALLFTGVMTVYTLRVNISVAADDIQDELNWSDAQKGVMLSSFYWGYALGQIPASLLVQLYGAKWIFGFSILLPSVLTLFVPSACRSSFGLALFVRALIGLCESASFPAVFHFFPIWVPLKEKTFMIPAIISGMYMGEIVGFSLSGSLVASDIYMNGYNYGQWPAVFYVFGFLGIVWFPFWAVYAYESPAHHPLISAEELALINEGKEPAKAEKEEEEVAKPVAVSAEEAEVHTAHQTQFVPWQGMLPTITERDDSSFEVESKDSDANDTSRVKSTASMRKFSTHLLEQALNTQRQMSINPDADRLKAFRTTPWKAFFTSPVSLTLFVNSWAYGWISFTLLSETPSFLSDELGFNDSSAGILSVFPYLALFLSTVVYGKLFNYLQDQQNMSKDSVRQIAEFIALLGSSVGLIICGFLGNIYAAYCMLIFTQIMMGAVQTGLGCAYSDVAPNYSSPLNSVGNCVSAMAGIVGPIVVSLCLDSYPGIVGWRIAFFITAIFAAVALAFWARFQTSQVVVKLNTPALPNEKCCGQ